MENLEMVKVMQADDLKPEKLANKIVEYLYQPVVKPFKNFELQGAQKTAQFLKELLECKVAA